MNMKTNYNTEKPMAFDLFERKYISQIEMLVERILDTNINLNESNYDELYDNAYEEAVYLLAAEKMITLE